MEARFNSGNLMTDVLNIADEIRMLKKLQNKKRNMIRDNQIHEDNERKVFNTIAKVEQMRSDGTPFLIEKGDDYINDVHGLKKFTIQLNATYDHSYNEYFSQPIELFKIMMTNASEGRNEFCTVTSLKPYESQTNVTRSEYEYAEDFLKNLLPITVTIKAITSGIYYDISDKSVYLRGGYDVCISGISLNG